MRHLFYYYPSFLRFLIPLFVLQQTAFQLFLYSLQFIQYFEYDDSRGDTFWTGSELYEHMLGFTGMAMIFGGIMASRIGNGKQTLIWIVSIILLGHVAFYLQIPYLSFLGAIVCMVANCMLFIKIILNITVLFPVANDQKDNTLLAGVFIPYILLFVLAMIMSFLIGDFSKTAFLICSLIIYLMLIYLINQNNDLGYKIEEEEPTAEDLKQHQKGKWVLFGCSLILFIASICSSFLTYLGDLGNNYYSGGLGDLLSSHFGYFPIGEILSVLAVFIYLIVVFFNAKTYSKQFKIIMIGLISIAVCAGLDLLNTFYDIYELELFVSTLPDYILIIMITIPMVSIITHLNFSKDAPIWLGLFYGGTQLAIYLSSQLAGVIIPIKFMAWGSLILLIGSIIYLRENKDFLLEQLALDEPNQIVDDEVEGNYEEDPLNHFIDRSRPE